MTDETPPVLWISADVSGLSRRYHVTEREHVGSDPWVPKAKADASRRRAKLIRRALSDAKAAVAVVVERAAERLDLAEHDAEERDWRSGANEIARLIQRVRSIAESPEVAKLVADAEARGMERAAEICAGLADQVSDAALTGLPEQARLRESMEAAFTKARHAIRAEAAANLRAAEETGP